MKNSTKIRLIKALFALLLILVFIIVDAFYLEPYRLTITYHTVESEQVPTSFHDFSICFIADLHYGTIYNENNIYDLTDKVNLLQPDIILFGGDLVESLVDYPSDMDILADALNKMSAIRGKYAVLGNHDYESLSSIIETLEKGGFTLLDNSSIRLHNGTNESIRLVGVDSSLLGNPDIDKAFSEVRTSDFTILLTHTPDNALDVNSSLFNLALGGHSHGAQIYIPIISSFMLPPGSKTYSRGVYRQDESVVYVTRGIGTTIFKARLFCSPEITFYRLKKVTKNDSGSN